MQPDSGGVVTVTNLAEFFRDTLRGVLAEQGTAVEEQTEHYVVDMLTLFARAERLHESAPDGGGLKPLALMLSDALEAAGAAEREQALRRLGDVSLFMAGFFARGLSRRRGAARMFAELAAKFRLLVDALGEIGDAAYVYTQRDVLRLYEIWLKTGSVRARGLLRRLGVEPAPVALRAH